MCCCFFRIVPIFVALWISKSRRKIFGYKYSSTDWEKGPAMNVFANVLNRRTIHDFCNTFGESVCMFANGQHLKMPPNILVRQKWKKKNYVKFGGNFVRFLVFDSLKSGLFFLLFRISTEIQINVNGFCLPTMFRVMALKLLC